MGDLNIPRDEILAIQAIDEAELRKLVRQALQDEYTTALRPLQLESCGPYISSKYQDFESALADRRAAKSARKRAEYETEANRAGDYLERAVAGMKWTVEQQRQEAQRFHVDDDMMFPPYKFSGHLHVRITFRWRETIEDAWQFGGIEFTHQPNMERDYSMPTPKRKPSANQRERECQDKLFREWDHLRKSALFSVREYLRSGGSGASIPKTFAVRTDYRGALNNFSTRFWTDSEQP